jgi:hypothetical protein
MRLSKRARDLPARRGARLVSAVAAVVLVLCALGFLDRWRWSVETGARFR